MAGNNDADGLSIAVDGIFEVLTKGPPSVTKFLSDHDPVHNAAREFGNATGIKVPPDAPYHFAAEALFGPPEDKFVNTLDRVKERMNANEKDSKNDGAAK